MKDSIVEFREKLRAIRFLTNKLTIEVTMFDRWLDKTFTEEDASSIMEHGSVHAELEENVRATERLLSKLI